MVAAGKLNKEIAFDLGTAEKTVKVHRGNLMRKLNCGSLAELVRLAQELRPVDRPQNTFAGAQERKFIFLFLP
jgi:DNA-binding NarL/FixJ family response regulator